MTGEGRRRAAHSPALHERSGLRRGPESSSITTQRPPDSFLHENDLCPIAHDTDKDECAYKTLKAQEPRNILRILFERAVLPVPVAPDEEYFVIASLVPVSQIDATNSSFPRRPSHRDGGFTSRTEHAKGDVVTWQQVTEFHLSAIERQNLGCCVHAVGADALLSS
jgi:hypothetical protein